MFRPGPNTGVHYYILPGANFVLSGYTKGGPMAPILLLLDLPLETQTDTMSELDLLQLTMLYVGLNLFPGPGFMFTVFIRIFSQILYFLRRFGIHVNFVDICILHNIFLKNFCKCYSHHIVVHWYTVFKKNLTKST